MRMVKTIELVEALRCSITPGGPADDAACKSCAYCVRETFGGEELMICDCERMAADAAARIEELMDRCARYAEEIAVLQEKVKWVDVREKLPERDGHYLCRYVFGSGGKGFYGALDYYAIGPKPHFQHEGAHGMTVTHWMDISEVE